MAVLLHYSIIRVFVVLQPGPGTFFQIAYNAKGQNDLKTTIIEFMVV